MKIFNYSSSIGRRGSISQGSLTLNFFSWWIGKIFKLGGSMLPLLKLGFLHLGVWHYFYTRSGWRLIHNHLRIISWKGVATVAYSWGLQPLKPNPLLHHKTLSQCNFCFRPFCPTISWKFLITPAQLDVEDLSRKDHWLWIFFPDGLVKSLNLVGRCFLYLNLAFSTSASGIIFILGVAGDWYTTIWELSVGRGWQLWQLHP